MRFCGRRSRRRRRRCQYGAIFRSELAAHGAAPQIGYYRQVQETSAIELQGTVVLADLVRAEYFSVLRRIPWLSVIAIILFVLIAPVNAAPLGFIVLVLALITALIPYRIARRHLRDRSYLHKPIAWVFDSEAISSAGTGISSRIAWGLLKRVRETKSMFLLYHSRDAAVIVPKRFFRSLDEMDRWRQLVAAYVDPKLIEKPSFVGRWC